MERQVKISFEPVAHKYTDETGQEYTSVTTVIGKYKEPFNQRYWSMYTALRDNGFSVRPSKDLKTIIVNGRYRTLDSLYSNPINNHEVQLMVKKWKTLTEEACVRGNTIHDYLEESINLSKGDVEGKTNAQIKPQLQVALNTAGLDVVLTTKHDLDNTNLYDKFPAIYNRLLTFINMGCTIYAEKRIYTVQYLIAGMIDVLVVKGKQFCILDWKTNKDEMLFRSGYYKKQKIGNKWVKTTNWVDKKKYLKYPLNTVEECKGMIYSLQLSLYAYIMELWGYKLVNSGLEIFHIRPGLDPKLIKVRYLKDEVSKMLTHFKEQRTTIPQQQNNLFGIK